MTAVDLASFVLPDERHLPFILHSWRGSGLPRAVMVRLLQKATARVCVTHVAGSPDDLIGWAAAVDGVLVYAYTRFHLRKNGYGALAIGAVVPDAAPVRCACWTPSAQRLADHGFPLVFDYRARMALERLA